MTTMRHTVRVPPPPDTAWGADVPASVIGQQPRLTINFDWEISPLATTEIVDARLDDGYLVLTLELTMPEANAPRVKAFLPPDEDEPPVSIGYTLDPPRIRQLVPLPPGRMVPDSDTRASFTCPVCGAESWNPNDVRYGYCGRCHAFTGDTSGLL